MFYLQRGAYLSVEARRKIKKMRERPECGRRNESKKQTKKKNNDKAIGECVRDSRWEIEVKIKARPKNQSTPKYKLLTFNYLPGKEKHSLPKKEKQSEQDQKKPMGGAANVLGALLIQ